MPSPYGHQQVQQVGSASARLLEPPTFTVRASPTANIGDLTAVSTTQDGLTLAAGDTLLLTEQTEEAENGLYIYGPDAALTRWLKFDKDSGAIPGTTIYVSEGTARAGKRYQYTGAEDPEFGTDDLTFEEYPSSADVSEDLAILGVPTMEAVNATLVAGTVTISSGITVAANSEVFARPRGVITGSTDFAFVRELEASRVNGAPGVGSIVVEALASNGAKDVDAAGNIRVTIFTPAG